MDSIQAVHEFNDYIKKKRSKKCYLEFNGRIHKKVAIDFQVQTNNWIIVIPSNIDIPDNLLNTDYYEMEYDEKTHYLKIYTDNGTIYITSA